MKQFDIITIGNCMIDAFLAIQKNNLFSRLDRENKQVCFRFGEKIHVDGCEFMLGGNACNVGVGLSRLGYQTGLAAEIGDDEFSQKILHLLAKEPIDTSMVIQTKDQGSSFAIGINFSGERTLFVDHIKRKHVFSFEGVQAQWIYLTSLGIEWKVAYNQVISFVSANPTKVVFSPGTHQMEVFDGPEKYPEEREILENILKTTDILFVNKEEGIRIVNSKKKIENSKEDGDIKSILIQLQDMGPKVVSVTDGAKGAYSIDGERAVQYTEKFPNDPIEKTGAGDGYAAGFLGAIISGLPIDEAMRWGSVNAASVVEKTGAQPGLLSKNKIEEILSDNKDFRSKRI